MAQRFSNSVPSYLVQEQQVSTDSTESNESIATQIPTGYYQNAYGSNSIYQGQSVGVNTGFAPQSGPMRGVSNGYGAQPQYGSNSGYQNAPNSSTYNQASTYFTPNAYNQAQQPMATSQYGSESGYEYPGAYGSYAASQGGYPASQYNQINPYGAQNTQAPQYPGGYQTYNQTYGNEQQDYRNEQQAYINDQKAYGFDSASPTENYSAHRAPSSDYQNFHTTSALPYQANGMTSDNRFGTLPYAVQQPIAGGFRHGSRLPSNENRGRPASSYISTGSKSGSVSGSSRRGSNAIAPVPRPGNSNTGGNIQSYKQRDKFTNNQSNVEPAVSRPTSSARDRSPEKNMEAPTSSASDDMDPEKTPAPRANQSPRKAFLSEQRGGMQTPTLRHTRHKSIAGPEHSSHNKTLSWIGKTPLTEIPVANKNTVSTVSPPKMRSLTIGAGNDTALTVIGENDPFAMATPRRGLPGLALNTQLTPGGTSLSQAPRMSQQLFQLTKSGKPTYDAASDVLPFTEVCRAAKPDSVHGVLRIKNIPYSVSRSEIFAFLGRNARLVNENEHEPIHIVMERVTSKTLDCYVEFVNFNEAVNAVNRFETNRTGGKGGRLGQRHVEVELSSQDCLMAELFPKAKNVQWFDGHPKIIDRDMNDIYNSGFQGFVSKEELVMLVKHVEAPQRSPFSKDCPQRPFECVISTLFKYPWYMVNYITIEDRELIHKATVTLLKLLRSRLDDDRHDVDINISEGLYRRVWKAALLCPGFSPAQKDDFVFLANVPSQIVTEMGIPEFAAAWKTLWTIGPKRDAPVDLVNYFAAIIREHTAPKKELTLAERASRGAKSEDDKIFGNLNDWTDYPPHEDFPNLTLAQVALIEWGGLEKVLKAALQRQISD